MDARRPQGTTPDAIVVVNGCGTAVDCNNAFAQLCGTPAGVLVGQELAGVAPELADILNVGLDALAEELPESVRNTVADAVIGLGEQTFELDVQPFAEDESTGDRVVRLRGLPVGNVA